MLLSEQMIEGRDELARRQIAAGAKDYNRARLDGLSPEIQTAGQQLIQMIGLIHLRTMTKVAADFNPCFSYLVTT